MSQSEENDHDHHLGSEGSEDLDKHPHDSDHEEDSQENHEESKYSEGEGDVSYSQELGIAHGDVDIKGKMDKGGYAQINDTQKDDDDADVYHQQIQDVQKMGVNQQPQPGQQIDVSQVQNLNLNDLTPEMRQRMLAQLQGMSQENTVDVLQSCLNGKFKPFLACVQAGYLDKDYIVDPQIGRRMVHLISHFGNIKALRVLHEICKADISVKDYQGLNAVHYAAGSGEIETLKYLCEQVGEDVIEEKDTAGMTPLMHAASKNSVICFIYLYFEKK